MPQSRLRFHQTKGFNGHMKLLLPRNFTPSFDLLVRRTVARFIAKSASYGGRHIVTVGLAACLSGCVIVPADYQPTTTVQGPDDGQVAIVEEQTVTPVAVSEYYFVGGRYYYWHPGVNRYVVLRGRPPEGYHISSLARLEPRDRMGRVAERRTQPNERPPFKPEVAKQQTKKPNPQKKTPPQDKNKPVEQKSQ